MYLNKLKIRELYNTSCSHALEREFQLLITPSTLGRDTLKFIRGIVQYTKPIYLLEFGSGLSTLFLSECLKEKPNFHLFVIEHSKLYLTKTKELIGERNNISYFHCPIKLFRFRRKSFATYDGAYLNKIPNGLKFDFVLIDGPPGNRFGREALLYQLAPYLSPSTLICLDDANRYPEQEALANWQSVWPDGLDILYFPELKKGFAVIQIKNPANMRQNPFSAWEIGKSWAKATRQLLRTELRKWLQNES